jgi:hypothetical protein
LIIGKEKPVVFENEMLKTVKLLSFLMFIENVVATPRLTVNAIASGVRTIPEPKTEVIQRHIIIPKHITNLFIIPAPFEILSESIHSMFHDLLHQQSPASYPLTPAY